MKELETIEKYVTAHPEAFHLRIPVATVKHRMAELEGKKLNRRQRHGPDDNQPEFPEMDTPKQK